MTDNRNPLVPAEVDLTDFKYMPLYLRELRRSKAWSIARRQPEIGFFMINLWGESWFETPAGSLPNDDDLLADMALCQPERWDQVKDKVMHGWELCTDGRWYHPFLAEKVLIAWNAKQARRKRTEAAREARAKNRADRTKEAPKKRLRTKKNDQFPGQEHLDQIPDGPEPQRERYGRPSGQAARDPAIAEASPEEKELGREFISIFDATLVEVWGEPHRRPYPAANDFPTALKWVKAGVDIDLCRHVCTSAHNGMKFKKKLKPAFALAYFDEAISSAIASLNNPLPSGGSHEQQQSGGQGSLFGNPFHQLAAQRAARTGAGDT